MIKLLGFLLIFLTSFYCYLAPYTKVEESFTLQATHDLIHFPLNDLGKFDHVEFPGPVKRTFIGAMVIAWGSWPVRFLAGAAANKGLEQVIVRTFLGVINSLSIIYFFRSASPNAKSRRLVSRSIAARGLLLTAIQFHVPFYSSRTLPNMLAFPLVQISLGLYLSSARHPSHPSSKSNALMAGSLLTVAAVIFRLEIVALLAPITLMLLWRKSVGFGDVVRRGALVGVCSIAATVMIDSYFWQRWTWPEIESMIFNVVQGKSTDWGTMSTHFYLSNSLPKLLGLALPLALLSPIVSHTSRLLMLPAVVFVGVMSCLGHKEWRFIGYLVPGLDLCACEGLEGVGRLLSLPRWFRRVCFLGLVAVTLATTIVSTIASTNNYPGGSALTLLHTLPELQNAASLKIHISNLPAQTGASRFLQLHDSSTPHPNPWTYLKTEHLSSPADFQSFDVLVAEEVLDAHREAGFVPVKWVGQFERLRIGKVRMGEGWRGLVPLEVVVRDQAVVIMQKQVD